MTAMHLTSAVVEQNYDQMNQILTLIFGQNIHNGYWYSVDDDTPLEEAQQRLTDLMVEKTAASRDWSVLDVGCGLGVSALQLAKKIGCQVTGITNSQIQVAQATQHAHASQLNDQVKFQYADALSLPFADNSFDAVWAMESLCHIVDRPRAVREIARVLRPDGHLILVDFAEREPMTSEQKDWLLTDQFVQFMLLDEVDNLLKEAGLEFKELTDLSWNIAKSQSSMLARIQQNRQYLIDTYGSEFVEMIENNWLKTTAIFVNHLSYILLIGQKAIV